MYNKLVLLFVFQLLAIGLIAVGAYVQVAMKEYFGLIDGQFSSAAVLLVVVGVIIFFIASFGCFGAIRESRVLVLVVSVQVFFFF